MKTEIEKMWQFKTTTLPVIVEDLGMIKKGTDKHINKIPDRSSLYKMQIIAICGTAYLIIFLMKVFMKHV